MDAGNRDLLFTLLSGAVISPVLLWAGRKLYDSWRLKGTYLTIIGGTGFIADEYKAILPATKGVHFGISIRIINATDKVQALEKVIVMWRNVRHKNVKSLRHLIDYDPSIEEYDLKDKSIDEFFERGQWHKKNVLLPLILEPNGVAVFLRIECDFSFYETNLFFGLKKKELPEEVINTMLENMDHGEGIVKLRIDGKMRSYKGIIWPKQQN